MPQDEISTAQSLTRTVLIDITGFDSLCYHVSINYNLSRNEKKKQLRRAEQSMFINR